jgi:hypothetical protein
MALEGSTRRERILPLIIKVVFGSWDVIDPGEISHHRSLFGFRFIWRENILLRFGFISPLEKLTNMDVVGGTSAESTHEAKHERTATDRVDGVGCTTAD